MNHAFERMAGKPASEVIGKTVSDLWPDSIARPLADDDRQVLPEDRAFEFAEKTMSPDGSEIDWLAIKFPFRDSAGRRFVGCVSIDVTQARRAEAALRRSEQRFRLITESIDEIFWIANPEAPASGASCVGQEFVLPFSRKHVRIEDWYPPGRFGGRARSRSARGGFCIARRTI